MTKPISMLPRNQTLRSNVLLWDNQGNPLVQIGAYPNKSELDRLICSGVDLVVNLCTNKERHRKNSYIGQAKMTYIDYPFKSRSAPDAQSLYFLAQKLANLINQEKRLYIHSLNGNGRANLVGCYLIGYIANITDSFYLIDLARERYATRVIQSKSKFIEGSTQYQRIAEFPNIHQEKRSITT